jgi:hypothetical protein
MRCIVIACYGYNATSTNGESNLRLWGFWGIWETGEKTSATEVRLTFEDGSNQPVGSPIYLRIQASSLPQLHHLPRVACGARSLGDHFVVDGNALRSAFSLVRRNRQFALFYVGTQGASIFCILFRRLEIDPC